MGHFIMKQETKLSLLIIFLILILTVTIITITVKQKSKNYNYNSFDIIEAKKENVIFYLTKLYINNNPNPTYLRTRYDPKKLKDIPVENIKDKVIGKQLGYISINPDENLSEKAVVAALELDSVIDTILKIPLNSAYTKEYKNNTIKTCNDANKTEAVIILTLGNDNKVFSNNECVVVQATDEDNLIKAADRFGFYLLGVMNES